jgi:hypothetical protein
VKELLDKLNEQLKDMGMLTLAIANPKDCISQEKNARYMDEETMKILVDNTKKTGALESVPLVTSKLEIISGHQRVEAAKRAKVNKILVLVYDPETREELVSKQLAHNALVGRDDTDALVGMYGEIQALELQIASGLAKEIKKLERAGVGATKGTYKEFTILFLPEDEGLTDEAIETVTTQFLTAGQNSVRLTSMRYYERFAKAIRKIKRVENIKMNGVAVLRLVELAEQKMRGE